MTLLNVVQKPCTVQMFSVRSSSSVQCSYCKRVGWGGVGVGGWGGFLTHCSLARRKQKLSIQTWIFLETDQCQQLTTFHRHKRQVCETDGHKSSAGNTFQMLRWQHDNRAWHTGNHWRVKTWGIQETECDFLEDLFWESLWSRQSEHFQNKLSSLLLWDLAVFLLDLQWPSGIHRMLPTSILYLCRQCGDDPKMRKSGRTPSQLLIYCSHTRKKKSYLSNISHSWKLG